MVRLQRALRHHAGARASAPPLPPAVDVLAQLTQALAAASELEHAAQRHPDATAWRLRSLPPASPSAPIVLDPLGQLLVKQQVVPLNTGARHRHLRRRAGGGAIAASRVTRDPQTARRCRARRAQAAFAPAQFFAMSDDEKLAAPSFESMEAGCVFGDAQTAFDPEQVVPAPLEYRTISITLQGSSASTGSFSSAPYTISSAQLKTFTHSGAAARARTTRRPGALSQWFGRGGCELQSQTLDHHAERRWSRRHCRSRRAHMERVSRHSESAQSRRRSVANRTHP